MKKSFNFNHIFINKINENKDSFNKKFFKKTILKNKNKINYNNNLKSIDFKYKTKLMFKKNRYLVKDFFNLKYYRKFSLSKNLKSICNFNKKNFIINVEKVDRDAQLYTGEPIDKLAEEEKL